MAITSANQLELLQTAEAVAREKMIDPALVVEAMEESFGPGRQVALWRGNGHPRVSIDRKTGKATFTRVRTVIDPEEEEIENYQAQMTPEQAKPVHGRPETRRYLRRRGAARWIWAGSPRNPPSR